MTEFLIVWGVLYFIWGMIEVFRPEKKQPEPPQKEVKRITYKDGSMFMPCGSSESCFKCVHHNYYPQTCPYLLAMSNEEYQEHCKELS